MKIVIDIPEDYYNECKRLRKQGIAQVAEAIIANGTPYEERPHGEWDYEKVAFYGVCSNCGVAVTSNKAEMFLYEEMREFPHNINFCPNCGADMRGND